MLIAAITGLFVLVFGRALLAYVRSRDRLQGAVALVFTAVAALFFIQVARELFGEMPEPVRLTAVVLLFGQPFFTIGLVTLIRPVPKYVPWLGGIGWVVSSVAFVAGPSPLPRPASLAVVGYFAVTEIVAAGYLAAEVRRRTGAPRARMAAAAGGTALFAMTLLTAGIGPIFFPGSQVPATSARIIALGSAIAYVTAFLPPRWLRRLWSARAAYSMMGQLLGGPGRSSPQQTWQDYADTVVASVDAETALVVAFDADGEPTRLAAASRTGETPDFGRDELRRLAPAPVLPGPVAGRMSSRRAAERATERAVERAATGRTTWFRRDGGRLLVTTIPLALHAGGSGALVVLGRHRSLFTEDDVTLLSELGRQATVLADRDLLTTRLRDLVDELRAANHAKSDFVAAMSHELRTPLNAIIGFSELMGEEELVGERRLVPAEWVENVHSSGRHLLGLINDVLDLAKVEAGRIELRTETLDAGAAVAEAVAPLRPLIDAKSLRFTIAVPPVAVRADRLRLRQMLNNLLSNAIKFTPPDGSIYISAHRSGAETHISIADTGPGIDPDDQQRVFEEFHQSGDAESRSAGTGLGLTLTRRLAEAHAGRIDLHSQPGHGSRFTLVLPAADRQSVELFPPGGANSQMAARGGVLLIEDDPAAAGLLRTYLAGAGYSVIEAGTGEEGLAAAKVCAPDVILLDVLLPGMDGWAVLQQLKLDERMRHIPVVMVTVVDEREVGLALGAVDYFVKPVERTALLAWLTRHGLVPPLTVGLPQVLAVDADPGMLALVQRCLRQEGLGVITATTGAAALDLAREGHFDLVLCDLMLPDMDGFSFVTALHDDPRTSTVPVAVFTAADLTEPEKARLRGKTVGIVAKDEIDPTDLRRWLARAIRPLPLTGEPARERITA